VILLGVSWYIHLLNAVVILAGLILIGIILIQRGKGGGLAGAFGGVGGSSPFGSRAGDLFTRITLIVAAVWAIMIVVEVKLVQVEGKYLKEHPTSSIKQ
jgi:preprotein translocase subunit SecG